MSDSANSYSPWLQLPECKACEVLKNEIKYLREQNKELTETITSLLKPKPVVVNEGLGELEPLGQRGMTWARRRQILEAADRAQAAKMRESPIVAQPDDLTTKLEQELEIPSIAEG